MSFSKNTRFVTLCPRPSARMQFLFLFISNLIADFVNNFRQFKVMSLSRFTSTPLQNQRFSLPENIIHYMAKNPISSKLWKKLIQTCKYFYSKNPVIFVDAVSENCSNSNNTSWVVTSGETRKSIDLQTCSFKLWIIVSLSTIVGVTPGQISSLIQKVYRFDLKTLNLYNVSITFNEFHCLASSNNLIDLKFYNVVMKHADESLVELIQILEWIPRIKNFFW